jgi:hypothetical protein
MNRIALSLVTLAVLTSAPAFADHFERGDEHGARPVFRFEGRRGYDDREHEWREHQRREWNRRPIVTFGPMYRGPINAGHYELRDVQRWVDGQWNQVFVPGACTVSPWGQQQCADGSYQNVWQEGHYMTVQERVWVPCRY